MPAALADKIAISSLDAMWGAYSRSIAERVEKTDGAFAGIQDYARGAAYGRLSVLRRGGGGARAVVTSTKYAYSGKTLLAAITRLFVNGVATGTPTTSYVHSDNLGSTQAVSNSSGNLSQFLDYSPYGAVLASTNSGQQNLARQYTNQFSDPSGLVYDNARYYNPGQGQFLTEDPLFLGQPKQQNLKNPQSLNAYSYALDNPITGEDPTGDITQQQTAALQSVRSAFGSGSAVAGVFAAFGGNFGGQSSKNENEMTTDLSTPSVDEGAPGTNFSNDASSGGNFSSPGGTFIAGGAAVAGGLSNAENVVVYVARDSNGIIQYVGITNNFARRAAEHLTDSGRTIEQLQDLPDLVRAQARGVEQAIIDQQGLENLDDKINSISENNPMYEEMTDYGRAVLSDVDAVAQ